MHPLAKVEILLWYNNNKSRFINKKIADLGSFNINGTVKDFIPGVIGFDILTGKNVDVVIVPGNIPVEHQNKYGLIITTSALQCCPDSLIFKREIIDLLEPNGEVFVTMCNKTCNYKHSTSPNSYDFQDGIRMNSNDIVTFFYPEFNVISVKESGTDLFYHGKMM